MKFEWGLELINKFSELPEFLLNCQTKSVNVDILKRDICKRIVSENAKYGIIENIEKFQFAAGKRNEQFSVPIVASMST